MNSTVSEKLAINGATLDNSRLGIDPTNGYSITADSKAICDHMIKLLEARIFDMEHLVPWLLEIVQSHTPGAAAP